MSEPLTVQEAPASYQVMLDTQRVRPSYKQTEVGVIPEDWDCCVLNNICDRISVGLATSVTKHYRKSGVPIIRNLNIKDGYFEGTDMLYISEEFASANLSKAANAFDVLTVRTGSNLGQTCVMPSAFDKCQTFTTLITTPKKSLLDPNYLCLHMSSTVGRNEMGKLQVGGGKGNLNTGDLKKYRIAIPLLPEQRAIATALSDVDALLAAQDKLIAKKRDIKQAAMQQLLTGKQRLPGFTGEWEVKRLGNVGVCLRGVSYKGDSDLSPHDTQNTKRLLRSNNVQNAAVVTTDIQFVNQARVSEHQVMRGDDILICMANGSKALVGKAGLFKVNENYEYTFGAFMGCFRSNTDIASAAYIFFLFQTGSYRNYINNLLAGSSINNLKPSSIESLEFPFPSLVEQTAIAAVLSDMDADLTALEQQRDKTRALKQGMMQELLTGRIRLV